MTPRFFWRESICVFCLRVTGSSDYVPQEPPFWTLKLLNKIKPKTNLYGNLIKNQKILG